MRKIFELVEGWENKNLKCSKCGETENVKQKYVKENDEDIYYCDTCVKKTLFPNLYNTDEDTYLEKELKQLILDAKLEWEIKVYKELKPVGDEYRYIANYLVEHGVTIAK